MHVNPREWLILGQEIYAGGYTEESPYECTIPDNISIAEVEDACNQFSIPYEIVIQ
jgi:hypothetical protein